MRAFLAARAARGVGLIEVMISLVVISIGLLGVAKLNALSIGNSRVSGSRSMAAVYLGSLSSAMHANGKYWQVPATVSTARITLTGRTLGGDGSLASSTADCTYSSGNTAPACSPLQMASHDLRTWGTSLEQLPSGAGSVLCGNAVPVSCVITVSWAEKYIASNAANVAAPARQMVTQTLSATVQP